MVPAPPSGENTWMPLRATTMSMKTNVMILTNRYPRYSLGFFGKRAFIVEFPSFISDVLAHNVLSPASRP
jgi:hypothetical protein